MSEELIARKLTADGDGTLEDKRLTSLFLLFQQLEKQPNESVQAKLELTLEQTALSFQKQILAAEVCEAEAQRIKNIANRTESEIVTLKQKIEQIKDELAKAKTLRKHQQECDSLAKLINEKPSRQKTQLGLRKLEIEIDELQNQQKELESKLTEKRKNTEVLFMILNDDEANEDVEMKEEGEEVDSDVETK
ncbi:hypothetical protein M3Y94_00945300 [Aphelenchoides besseyi]|nr:hypothetical protein M3Y94_00945300 [Aphelenchoides besseyi]KAI6224862.1 hypothetical protein M3Y95_00797500 [Aphelenchoides besseyi]